MDSDQFEKTGSAAILREDAEAQLTRISVPPAAKIPHEFQAPPTGLERQSGELRAALTDIGERKLAEFKNRRLTDLYVALSQSHQAILHCTREDELYLEICRCAVKFGGMKMAWVGLLDAESKRIRPVSAEGEGVEYLEGIVISTDAAEPAGRGPTGTAVRENRPFWCQDFQHSPDTAPWHETGARFGWCASAALPLCRNGEVIGACTFYAAEVDAFDEKIRALLIEMSMGTSYALDNFAREATRQNAVAALEKNQVLLARAERVAHLGAWEIGLPEMGVVWSDEVCAIHDVPAGTRPTLEQAINFYAPESLEKIKEVVGKAIGEGAPFDVELQIVAANKCPRWVRVMGEAERDGKGKIVRVQGTLQDINAIKLAELRIEQLSHYDLLTGLPNRALLEGRIAGAIIRAQQHGRFIGVMFLNMDHFHSVNEMFGHAGGDTMLLTVARRLVEAVPASATVTRLSADTFVIALPDLDTGKEINRIAELIARKVYQPLAVGGQQVQLSAHMGIAVYPLDGSDPVALMKCADAALSDAKKSGGRNSFRFYSASMNAHARKLLTVGAELRNAIEQKRLVLHYQPQVDIISGSIVGAEALIRIDDPERGVISPTEFIAVAEETGLIIQMGEWVIREACRQMQQWYKETQTGLIIAVNLSPLQLHQSSLLEIVKSALDESGLPPHCLELEFTESAIMQNVRETISVMRQFKAMGLHLSIDDFGTGYSSLSYLKQFPVDKLKIDQSFVGNITQDPGDAAIVQAIIVLARALGLSTIAEGVETEAQLGYLRSLHCKEMQGYLYSRPLPAADFAALLVCRKTPVKTLSWKTLLLVDDEEDVLTSLKRILRRENYRILTASSAEEGLEVMAQNRVNVVISDQRMSGMSGVEFLHRVKTMHPDVVRMILSGYTEIGILTDAINKGEIYQFITKPWENESLIAMVREAFVRYEMLNRRAAQ